MKILMVCLGNICRSPLAEGIMKEKLSKYKLQGEVDSAGTSGYHAGSVPDPRSVKVAADNGLDITYQRSRRFQVEDFDHFDLIFAMDDYNYTDLVRMARNKADIQKISMLMDTCCPGQMKSVPDPYYGQGDGFKTIYDMMNEGCEAIAQKLANYNS
jgi:protein-tyrosine phosphatase